MSSSAPVFAPLLVGLMAAAPVAGVDLRWEGPPECGEEQFHAALARYLEPTAGANARLEVRARVRSLRGRWILELDVVDAAGTGTRQLTAQRCETVVEAAAFVVAQAIDRSSAAPAPDSVIPPPPGPAETLTAVVPPAPAGVTGAAPVGATDAGQVPAPAPGGRDQGRAPVDWSAGGGTGADASGDGAGLSAPVDADAPLESPAARGEGTVAPLAPEARSPSSRAGLRGVVRVRGGAGGVALPGVTAELGLLVGLTAARWRVDLVSLGRLPVRKEAAGEQAVGARLAMWAVGARGCGLPRIGRLVVPLCAGAEFGQVVGRSFGLMTEGRDASPWAAVTASPGLMWEPRRWLALTLEFELAVALLRHDWVIRGLMPIHRIGPVEARGFLGLEFRFGGPKIP